MLFRSHLARRCTNSFRLSPTTAPTPTVDPCSSFPPQRFTPQLTQPPSENRLRLPLEIIKISRDHWPSHKPLFIRISATDWHPAGEKNEAGGYISWGIEQSKVLLAKAVELGADLMDVSSGGNDKDQKIAIGPGYQVRPYVSSTVWAELMNRAGRFRGGAQKLAQA